METLRNLREHLLSIETEVSRTILSIEKGLESLEDQQEEQDGDEEAEEGDDLEDDDAGEDAIEELPSPVQPVPRRASLAADTMGGPNYQ